MNNKKIIRGVLAALLAALMVLSIVACVPATTPEEEDNKYYTYNTYTASSPTNWNELTYQDNNDTQIMSYIGSSFFSFDFKFDADGKIVTGDFVVKYEAATKLEDVTAAYAEAWGLPADGKGYAYKITLREDLKWENGDPIKAEDFVYTMEQQLDPAFKNYRADSFYVGSTIIANAQKYAKQGESGWFAASTAYSTYSEALDGALVFTLGPDTECNSYIRDWVGFPDSYDIAATVAYLNAN